MELSILYRDTDLIVINKPSGLLVHRTMLDKTETQFALQLLRDQIGQMVFPVHRLDRPTSGALLFALSAESARIMASQFASGSLHKRYLAIVRGFAPQETLIDYPLREELDSIVDRKALQNKPAQSAVTLVRRLAQAELPFNVDRFPTARYSLVSAEPKTGRKHQIRRHLRHLGHPIVGDVTHGVGKHNRFFASHFAIRRLLLACVDLTFQHPRHQTEVQVHAPLSAEFTSLCARLGWQDAI